MIRSRYGTHTPAIEARLGARLATGLSMGADGTSHEVSERLRVAREQALARARLSRQPLASPGHVVLGTGRSAALAGFAPWRERLALALPLLLMVAGLVAIEQWTARERMLAAADIDAQLLTDSLPPTAYSDPGFAEYLRTAPSQ
ncbi:DUF3619 family protein [Rubrivivax rivuli]|uniref:DUF3619 family protein n=1 Tax=Rubrivivax rivuli TaxID=1862385 RepID=A0A437RFD5_9BURK|nr:DUF3619 family protein [Rubrivivax rivuli]RVU45424.1 DUF3619 family protein [Rubrivivax rivuli]